MTAIQLSKVNLSYRMGELTSQVLRDVSLNIARGDMVAICGPSGSGKSTLLYLLGCLLKPDQGKIIIDGVDIATLSDFELAHFRSQKIGFVFQQFFLLPKTNVIDNVLLPTHYPIEISKTKHDLHDAKERAQALLSSLGLAAHIEHKPNQLSGGQQQRVAIARALVNGAEIILADEPTGNLDSHSAAQVMAILKDLHRQGKTVIIITHDEKIASQCAHIYRLEDGRFVESAQTEKEAGPAAKKIGLAQTSSIFRLALRLLPMAKDNLVRHRVRSQLTMLGVAIGVAAVMGALTLGSFTKEKLIQSYAELGVNTLQFSGYPNFSRSAQEVSPAIFRQFGEDNDINALLRNFPQIKRWSPLTRYFFNGVQVYFGGKKAQGQINLVGVNEDWLPISGWKLKQGRNFHASNVTERDPVCIIGNDFDQQLFGRISPLNELLYIRSGDRTITCKVIGVLANRVARYDFASPNLSVYLPYTFGRSFGGGQLWDLVFELKNGSSIEKTGSAVKAFFEQKYGNSAIFVVNYDSVAVEQMIRFLSILGFVLAILAFISLLVGGMGITNMMLVSVAERMKEIGIRKAVGATHQSIRLQFVLESLVLCSIAGVVGLVFGFLGSELAIYVASRLTPKLTFEWRVDEVAMLTGVVSIVVVGVLSGLSPALKAEKIQVVEALRAE